MINNTNDTPKTWLVPNSSTRFGRT